MSLRFKFISTLTVAGLIAAFSSLSTAQETKAEAPTTAPNKAERPFKKGHRGGFGQFGGKGFAGKMHGRHGVRGLMRGIELTEAQKEQMRSIREANKPDQAIMDEFRSLRKAKHDGTLTADQEARIKTLREQTHAKGKAVHEQMMNVLTAEQKAQIEKNKLEMRERHEQFRQKREEFRKQKADAASDKPKIG